MDSLKDFFFVKVKKGLPYISTTNTHKTNTNLIVLHNIPTSKGVYCTIM